MKVGLIGYGRFAKLREECFKSSKVAKVDIVGYFDPHCSDNTLRKFTKIESLLREVDAVLISVPPKLAPGYVQKSIQAGKHVFCEKPAAINLDNLNEIDAAFTSNKVLAYGFNHRVHQSIVKIKEVIDSNKMGRILWLRGRYGKEVDDKYFGTWRCDKSLNGGGILIDQGIHMVDLMAHLAGGFDGAQAVLSTNYLNIEGVEDNGFITLFSTTNKITASIHTTLTQWRYLFSLEMFLEKGSIVLNGLRTKSGNYGEEVLTIKPNSKNESLMDIVEEIFTENISWQTEIDAFLESCDKNEPYPYAGFQDAVQTTTLMDLIYKEAKWV
jgi:1,5-anhydro-D-fructose reductase (1,5-anhydro-D-mannitol-forming)